MSSTHKIRESIDRLEQWLIKHRFRGFDPGDGQLSFLSHLAFGNRFLKRALTAAILRVPFNIRPWIGIRPHTSTKGMGYIGWGYLKMYAHTGDPRYAKQARFCLDWLI